MFIKYGIKKHLTNLKNKGEMHFCPCKQYREFEEKQNQKGIGDKNDGGLYAMAEYSWVTFPDGSSVVLHNTYTSVIIESALKTPVFCLRISENQYITKSDREILHDQFPEYTHALLIRDENAFLKQVRYRFRSKAFAHEVFYQDQYFVDFIEFLKSGKSRMNFYQPKPKEKEYFGTMTLKPIDGKEEQFRIDNSNYYRTMFRKATFFSDQQEFRIVLPYERIDNGQNYQIGPIQSELVNIDDLINDK